MRNRRIDGQGFELLGGKWKLSLTIRVYPAVTTRIFVFYRSSSWDKSFSKPQINNLMHQIRRVQPTRCDVSQFIYFCKLLMTNEKPVWNT